MLLYNIPHAQWTEIQQLDYGDPKPRRWETWNDLGSFERWFAAGEPDSWFPVVASIADLPRPSPARTRFSKPSGGTSRWRFIARTIAAAHRPMR
ncbi:MAG TPA: hypothetical protein PJ986_08045 [Gammaproteobacteria bacterium]|nr:hypothetical protein [Gammaproteobacteria bacterium]